MMRQADSESSNSNGTSRPVSNGSRPSPLLKVSNATNGTHKPSSFTNGSFYTNGNAHPTKPKARYHGHDREEVTRLLIQTLEDLGYSNSARALSSESGSDLEDPSVAALRNAVLQGQWPEAEALLLGGSGHTDEGGVSIYPKGLELAEGYEKNVLRFWLRQQKFLELLEARDTGRALTVLRTELTPLNQEIGRLHELSSYLMCQSAEEVRIRANWDGIHGDSRQLLLSDISRCISPSVMIPEHRLATLLHQVKQGQIDNCLYHNTSQSPSLFSDHMCDKNDFPRRTVHIIETHIGEVWQLGFSNDGTKLASCGSGNSAVIFNVSSMDSLHTLEGHDAGIGSLAWSPDDSYLLTCSTDRTARLWDIKTGECKQIYRYNEPVTSCAWSPDGHSFVTGCLSKDRSLCQWSLDGELIYDWGRAHRVQDVSISRDGHRLVAMDNNGCLHHYNFVTRALISEFEITTKEVGLCSVNFSQSSSEVLVSKTTGETMLVDIDLNTIVKTYEGYRDEDKEWFVIRSTFGGANENFVVSGSRDGTVYVWHKENSQLIEKLKGHTKGCCNSVSWNPRDPGMFASAGDDGNIRIWATDKATMRIVNSQPRTL